MTLFSIVLCRAAQRYAKGRIMLKSYNRHMIGLERGKVTLYIHNPVWNTEATRTIKVLKEILGDIATETEHVGSTAVNTIMAKPIIDIALAVPNFTDIIGYNSKLELHGFYYRYAMDRFNNIFRGEIDLTSNNIRQLLYACGGYYDGSNKLQTHFIHVVKTESTEWRNYIKFRDHLNTHPLVAKEYENLKIMLYRKYADNREEYTAHKRDFIQRILNSI